MLLAGCTHSFGVSMRLPQVEERLLGHGARYCLDSTSKKGGKWKQRAQGDRQRKQIVFFTFLCVFWGNVCEARGGMRVHAGTKLVHRQRHACMHACMASWGWGRIRRREE